VPGGGIAAVVDDFRLLELYHERKRRRWKSEPDKGHRAELARFMGAVRENSDPPPAGSYVASTRLTFALVESLRTGAAVDLGKWSSARHE